MKKLIFLLCLIPACTYSEIREKEVYREVIEEEVYDIGYGFKQVYRTITAPEGHWEGVNHFVFIYYKEIELGNIRDYKISPTGLFVIYTDSSSGSIVKFDTCKKKKIILEPYQKERGIAVKYEIDKYENEVMVTYSNSNSKVLKLESIKNCVNTKN